MAAPPYLCHRAGNGAAGQPYRLPGGDILDTIGNTIASVQDTSLPYFWSNYVVEFEGDLYCWHRNVIRKYNSGTGAWDTAYTVTMESANNYGRHGGLYVMNVSGVPNLVGVCEYLSEPYYVRYLPGTGWSSGQITTVTGAPYIGECFVYRDTLFFSCGSTPVVIQWGPNNPAVVYTPADLSGTVRGLSHSFSVLDNTLYMVGARTDAANTQGVNLWRFEGGAFVKVQAIGTTISGGTLYYNNSWGQQQSHCALWSDGTNLYCIVRGAPWASQTGWYCFKLVPSGSTFTEFDLTNPVIPSALRSPNISTLAAQWWCVKDNDTNPASPSVYFYYQQDDGSGSVLYYEWVNDSTVLAQGTTVGAYGLAMSQGQATAGEYTWSPGEWNVQIVGTSQGAGGLTLSFKAWGGGTKSVNFYYSLDEETPTSQCTLTGTATGGSAVRNGNQVDTVGADGSTTYTITWDFFTDGASIGERFTLMPYIF